MTKTNIVIPAVEPEFNNCINNSKVDGVVVMVDGVVGSVGSVVLGSVSLTVPVSFNANTLNIKINNNI